MAYKRKQKPETQEVLPNNLKLKDVQNLMRQAENQINPIIGDLIEKLGYCPEEFDIRLDNIYDAEEENVIGYKAEIKIGL